MSEAIAKQDVAIIPAPVVDTSLSTRSVEVIAAEIRSIDDQARKVVLQSAIDIGHRLHEAKTLVAHGEWGEWLKTNVNYSQSTAGNFMKIATDYQSTPALSNLSYSQAVALLSLPAEDRETFVEENNAAEMSTRELQAAIKEKQELERKLAQQKEQYDKWAKGQKEQFDKLSAQEKSERDALYEQYQLETNLRQAQEDRVRELEQEVEKAQNAGGDVKETAKIKTELRKAEKAASDSKKKIEELGSAMKQKEAELEQTVTARLAEQRLELEKQAVEKEKGLNEQLAKLNQQLDRSNNEAFLKAKLQLQQIISQGDVLVKAIADIKEPEEQVKLKEAAKIVADKLKALF
ncbi:hypothetical protein BK133_05230 [Paenibacillus sp. FSL H8-0548]|uniref:DUF3102 domain-containing protein n=1 Tax=Paenibacillus sp. FSL H8-0548 TaxID=1920422 RepID=UPI00096C0876|nr:DUF3102 domain-containing protein [Paenibacillus sp. FSL H8-0548]OMF37460.1 hypothetical protein BK133_05230 [Paenibacillus sp. FSL H8-0548]